MTGPDVTRRREAIGLSLEQFAEELHEHPDQVRAWEGIRGSIPRSLGRRLEWTLALAERKAAIRAAGIPPCPVVQELVAKPLPRRTPQTLKALSNQLAAHAASCPICQQRQAVWDAQPPLPPAPLPPLVAIFAAIQARTNRLPSWLRPAVWGALLVGALALFRTTVLLAVSPAARSWQAGGTVAGALALGAYGGVAGGVAYHFARAATAPYGRAGDYLTGIAAVAGVAVAFATPLAALDLDPFFRTGRCWLLLAVGVVLIGLVLGHRIFRSRTAATL